MISSISKSRCIALLSQNYIGHLSYIFNNKPFVVPITYFYDDMANAIIGYSGEGHKVRALRANSNVSLQVGQIESINNWKSVLIQGIYREYEGSTAKIKLHKFSEGVKSIINFKKGKKPNFISEFSSKLYKGGLPIVFKIDIEEMTGKERFS